MCIPCVCSPVPRPSPHAAKKYSTESFFFLPMRGRPGYEAAYMCTVFVIWKCNDVDVVSVPSSAGGSVIHWYRAVKCALCSIHHSPRLA